MHAASRLFMCSSQLELTFPFDTITARFTDPNEHINQTLRSVESVTMVYITRHYHVWDVATSRNDTP